MTNHRGLWNCIKRFMAAIKQLDFIENLLKQSWLLQGELSRKNFLSNDYLIVDLNTSQKQFKSH